MKPSANPSGRTRPAWRGRNSPLVVLTTCGSDTQAAKLSRALVERRLAACVNQIPGVRSTYRWKGKVQSEGEVLLLIKNTRGRLKELSYAISELHSYELPEIVALAPVAGEADYLDWVAMETRD
jgi:periplasmic divalent cation tolerance protein